jgi:hypothetical protein
MLYTPIPPIEGEYVDRIAGGAREKGNNRALRGRMSDAPEHGKFGSLAHCGFAVFQQ